MRELQHNIVNVLYTVKGIIETHLVSVEEGRFPKKEEALEHAQEALKKSYERINKALEITRRLGFLLKAGEKTSASSRNVSLKSAWQETLKILRREFPFNKIEIIERMPEDFPLIQCSAGDLQEILYNLLQNAVQAMGGGGLPATHSSATESLSDKSAGKPAGGALAGPPADASVAGKLILRACFAFSTQEEPSAVITVSDTGPGIRQEILGRLFEPFFTTKSPQEGSGLGLYLTKALVMKNRGRITVSSYPGAGATFTLELPLASQNVPGTVRGDRQGVRSGRRSRNG